MTYLYDDEFEYKASRKENLKTHNKSIDENFAYSCDQCEYKAKRKKILKVHLNIIMGMSH